MTGVALALALAGAAAPLTPALSRAAGREGESSATAPIPLIPSGAPAERARSRGTTPTASGDRVYEIRPAVDYPLTVGAAVVAGLPAAYAGELIHPRCPCLRSEVNPLDRFAIGLHSASAEVASDVTAGLALVLPPILDALRLGAGPALRDDLTVYAETLAATGALVQLAKYAAQRPLPRTYAGEPDLVSSPRGYRSFFSGHAALTAAALTSSAWTLRLRDGERGWPWLVVGAATASVAAERVAAGRHFPSDVVVGAAVGLGVGTLVPLLHARSGPPPVVVVPAAHGAALAGTL